ncbi:MAG: hypothetical protein M3Y59_06310 [Myxococcota bacterium]|nr:hypothetical protein [Myxococcota bacterium]
MDISKLGQRLGRVKRRGKLSIAASVVGVATAGVALGYGVSRLLRLRREEPQPEVKPEAALKAVEPEPAVRSVENA